MSHANDILRLPGSISVVRKIDNFRFAIPGVCTQFSSSCCCGGWYCLRRFGVHCKDKLEP